MLLCASSCSTKEEVRSVHRAAHPGRGRLREDHRLGRRGDRGQLGGRGRGGRVLGEPSGEQPPRPDGYGGPRA